jgi:OOP family OmpA-OmpF porin
MFKSNKSLAYSAALVSALSLASCSSSQNTAAPQAADTQHRFNVYFDVAKSDLTPEAQQVIGQAVAEASRNAGTKIVVVAPETDKARRADKVQAALVAAGVSPDRIDARWIGPQGAPAPGVRDPRNRVVEISFEPDRSSVGETAKVFVSKRVSN